MLQHDLARTSPQRWPGYAPAALEAGVAATFIFPVQVGRIRLGVPDRSPVGEAVDALRFTTVHALLMLLRSETIGAMNIS